MDKLIDTKEILGGIGMKDIIETKNYENKDEEAVCYCCGEKAKVVLDVNGRKLCRTCGVKYFVYSSKLMDYLNENSWENN